MFMLYGPNTNHGSGSVPYTLECQFNYVIDAIRRMRARRPALDRPEARGPGALARARSTSAAADTVWTTGGCTTGTRTPRARNTNNWPGPWLEYRRRTRRINPADYRAAA